jgi:hypothetical protein
VGKGEGDAMTDAEWGHCERMADEGEAVMEIEVGDEEVAAITANAILSKLTLARHSDVT